MRKAEEEPRGLFQRRDGEMEEKYGRGNRRRKAGGLRKDI